MTEYSHEAVARELAQIHARLFSFLDRAHTARKVPSIENLTWRPAMPLLPAARESWS